MLDLDRINTSIVDRSDTFYWQTDRSVSPQEAGEIWADRHRYFTDAELENRVSELIGEHVAIDPLQPTSQTNLGNVNSVRVAILTSGEKRVVRCHPKGIDNGYFHAESLAAQRAKSHGLPSYSTIAIHDFVGGEDFAFHVLEMLPGIALKRWLEQHPTDERPLLGKVGQMMARMHAIAVDGFGPFNNTAAQSGKLTGLHRSLGDAVRAALPMNLSVLASEGLITPNQIAAITELYSDSNALLRDRNAVLVHNDFADWNLLTNGTEITGILDWDECVGGIPASDIACWGTFFNPERMEPFLEGYFGVSPKRPGFDEEYELLRLRYVISKMTLRLRRFTWEKTDAIRERIESGKLHLADALKYFRITP